MGGSVPSVDDLRRDLDKTNGVVNILERASRELTTIIGWDEAVRTNPLRRRQLSAIEAQLAAARGKKASLARQIERLQRGT